MTSNEMALMASIAVDMKDKEVDEVLDKIRAEIEHVIDNTYDSTDHDKSLYNGAYKDGLYDALDIIDKYKAESKPHESESKE